MSEYGSPREPRTGSGFPLESFEVRLQADPRIIGTLYTGSLSDGTADRFSDLDIEFWVSEEAWAARVQTVHDLMRALGEIQFMYPRDEGRATGFVGEEWQRVDLVLHPADDTRPHPEYGRANVVKDFGGRLAGMVARSTETVDRPSLDQARAAIQEAIDSQIYASLHNARGAVWSAMGEVSYRAAELYTLLALGRGRQSFGFRYVEQLLSPDERAMLSDTWPAAPERGEVRRATRALWEWTREVWRETETVLGDRLDIAIDETALLAAVDRLYG